MNKEIIHSVFEHTVRQFPEHIAVEDNSRRITYRELNAKANCVAHGLAKVGVGDQNVVGIYLDASIDYIVALLGVLKVGAVFMPLNTRFPDKRLNDILNKTKPSIFITTAALQNEFSVKIQRLSLSFSPSHILVLDHASRFSVEVLSRGTPVANSGHFSDENLPLTTGPDDGCYIVTTSASTGEPKAILGRQKGLSHFIHWEIDEFSLNNHMRVSLLSAVTFDVSLRDIFVPLIVGGTLCIPTEETRRNPRKLLNWMQNSRITLTHIVPTLFRLLTREIEDLGGDNDVLPSLKYVLIAGETLYGNDVINWRKVTGNRIELVNLYGPSETTLAKLFYRIKDYNLAPEEIVPIGKPIRNTEVFIISNGKPCSVGETGEIYIKTPFMSKGYYNAPKLTGMSFVQSPLVKDREDIIYRTGDHGKFNPGRSVQFVGRLDGQIKLHGKRVEIGEIEVVLRQHPQVRQAVVEVREDGFGNGRLVGYVVPKRGERPPVESLRRFSGDRLPDYMVPSVFVTLKALPLTHNEKIDRKALPEPDRARPEMEQGYVAPSSALERTLSNTWCEVLGYDRVGIYDNFFDLGGTSILAARLIVLVQKALGVELPIVKLFQYPNISLLAEYLSEGQRDQPSFDTVQDRAQRRRAAFSRQYRSTMR